MSEKTIKTKSGNTLYTDTKSDISDKGRTLIDLVNGAPPKNKEEKELLQDIKKIDNKGHVIEVPSN